MGNNTEERIIYLKEKIKKQYKTNQNFKEVVSNRSYDKTIIEKLEKK